MNKYVKIGLIISVGVIVGQLIYPNDWKVAVEHAYFGLCGVWTTVAGCYFWDWEA